MPVPREPRSVRLRPIAIPAAMILAAGVATPALAQLRIATWNITNYISGRVAPFQTALYGSFQGRTMAPDVLMGQEFTSVTAAQNFLSILNTAPGSPRDWAVGPYVDGPDTDSVIFYRTGRVQLLGFTRVSAGGPPPRHPRDLLRYDIRPVGYTALAASVACYVSHMKAGDTPDDQARRLLEAQAARANAELLPAGWNFLIAGDFNIQSASQSAYTELIGSKPNNRGRFFDPINSPGTWNNNSTYRFIHTQAPGGVASTTGGMDDRLDFILLSGSLVDRDGFDYIGDSTRPYSTLTWNDPNHSYRAWGNDGTSFNRELTTTGNAFVGEVIAQALRDSTTGDSFGGHLPVVLDLRLPPKITSPTLVDFGTIPVGPPSLATLTVSNAGDTARWGVTGIADLRYQLAVSAPFAAPSGQFVDAAGGAGVSHVLSLSALTPGTFTATLTITSNAPDEPTRQVTLRGTIAAAACAANCDGSTDPVTGRPTLDIRDFACFQNKFALADPAADCSGDGILDIRDFACFQNAFALGCP